MTSDSLNCLFGWAVGAGWIFFGHLVEKCKQKNDDFVLSLKINRFMVGSVAFLYFCWFSVGLWFDWVYFWLSVDCFGVVLRLYFDGEIDGRGCGCDWFVCVSSLYILWDRDPLTSVPLTLPPCGTQGGGDAGCG